MITPRLLQTYLGSSPLAAQAQNSSHCMWNVVVCCSDCCTWHARMHHESVHMLCGGTVPLTVWAISSALLRCEVYGPRRNSYYINWSIMAVDRAKVRWVCVRGETTFSCVLSHPRCPCTGAKRALLEENRVLTISTRCGAYNVLYIMHPRTGVKKIRITHAKIRCGGLVSSFFCL